MGGQVKAEHLLLHDELFFVDVFRNIGKRDLDVFDDFYEIIEQAHLAALAILEFGCAPLQCFLNHRHHL